MKKLIKLVLLSVVLLLTFALPTFAATQQSMSANKVIPADNVVSQASSVKSPSGVKANAISSSEIAIGWKKVSGAEGYHVYYAYSKKGPYIPFDGIQAWVGDYSATLYGLSTNCTVYFKVTAVKNGKESKYSSVAKATTLAAGPTNLVAAAISSSEIIIQWDKVSGADYYYLYVSADGVNYIPYTDKKGKKIRAEWLKSTRISNLPTNSTRYFKVTYVKKNKESDFSNVASATTFSDVKFFPLLSDVPMPNDAELYRTTTTEDDLVNYIYITSALPLDFGDSYPKLLSDYGWEYYRTENYTDETRLYFTKDDELLLVSVSQEYTFIIGAIH